MTQAIIPYRPVAGDPEDVSQILSNFDAILSVLNGDIRDDNISPSAAIGASKLAPIPGSRIVFSRGVTPPTSPQDGDLWQVVADATAGVTWLFRYNAGSASANKWEFLGGAPLMAIVETQQSTTATAYADLTTAGPSVTVPRPGDFLIEHGFNAYSSGVDNEWGTVKLGAAAAADTEGQYAFSNVANMTQSIERKLQRALLANDVVKQMYRTVAATTCNFRNRWVKVTPVRVS